MNMCLIERTYVSFDKIAYRRCGLVFLTHTPFDGLKVFAYY